MDKTAKIKEFIVENFLFGDDDGLEEDTSFQEMGFIDSMGIMELVTFLEETFNIHVKDDELIQNNLDSLKKITNFVEMKCEKN